jgi:hypothetical protein
VTAGTAWVVIAQAVVYLPTRPYNISSMNYLSPCRVTTFPSKHQTIHAIHPIATTSRQPSQKLP